MGAFTREWKGALLDSPNMKVKSAEVKRVRKALDEGAAIVADVDKLVARYKDTPTEAMVKKLEDLAARFSKLAAGMSALERAASVSAISETGLARLDKMISAMAGVWVQEWRPVPGGTVFKAAGPWTREWQDAKKTFEAKTNRKKPSRTILGAFRMSSGIEKALSTCEVLALKHADAPDEKTSAKLKTARADMRRAASGYVSVLKKAKSGDAGADPAYLEQLDVLAKELERIADSLDTACDAAEDKWQVAPYDLKRCATAFAAATAAVDGAQAKLKQAIKGSGSIDAKTFQKALTDPAKAAATALQALQKLAVAGEGPRAVLALPTQQVQVYARLAHRDIAKGKASDDPVRSLLQEAESFFGLLDRALDKALREWQGSLAKVGRRGY
ncbi:hypothetical protein [Caenispirillum bisanense]|uniref:hypothetical protein n=1 Tax=Caenispirillum bisanense TaxID=414052 RepID=UPI0031DD25E9